MNSNNTNDAIRNKLPEFVKACEAKGADTILMDQAAFSSNEAELLGQAIKFAGEHGKTVTIPSPNASSNTNNSSNPQGGGALSQKG